MTTFDSLATRRRAYVDAARDNGFEEGLRRLLADLYPDNAHFIYELLQNAEDALASEVTFRLRDDGLLVEHDGTRLFDLRDIDSITGIGQSTKADDATSIGKFGVGFKAVFAYTQTPAIHSGEHSFEIHDLFVPTKITPEGRPGCTAFWFPFDREDKLAPQAAEEVARALRDVSRSTLLFLNHIATILCVFPDGDERLLERRKVTDRVIAIESAHEDTGSSYWYRITGDVSIDGKQYPVAAAFALMQNDNSAAEGDPSRPGTRASTSLRKPEFTVSPTNGQVFIYFPAVRENSGLKFHIHAPFASTVARDSVRDEAGNILLVQGIADIVAAALPDMRRLGLVNDGLLEALPNNADDLPARYAVVRERVREAFQSEPLTPEHGGTGFAPSARLIRSASPLRAVLSTKDADLLRSIIAVTDVQAAGWLPERDGRPRQFLDSLDAIDFGVSELGEVLTRVGDITSEAAAWGDEAEEYVDEDELQDLEAWADWIASKDDAWLRSFYAALGRVTQQSHNPYPKTDHRHYSWEGPLVSLAGAPIIRIQSSEGAPHVVGAAAFLPIAPGLRGEGLVLDTLVPFIADDTRAAQQEAKALQEFYSNAGVKQWDAAAQLDARFRGYPDRIPRVEEEHLRDLSDLVQLINDGAVSPETYSNRKILVGTAPGGTAGWTAPSNVYLDEPFDSTGLSALYGPTGSVAHGPVALAAAYVGQVPDVAALAKKLGAIADVRIEYTSIFRNPRFEDSWRWSRRENDNRVTLDWAISQFEAIVKTDDPRLLARLWQVVVNAPETCATATYRANASSTVHRIDSQLLQSLRSFPWILDRDGNRRLPEAATKDEIAESLVWRESPLLKLAGFGKKAELIAAKRRGDDVHAKELGFTSAEDARAAAEAINGDPDAFKQYVEDWKARRAIALPEAASAAPWRRASRAAERAADAPERRYELRERSVRVQLPGFRDDSKQYLRALYTNDNGEMTCQICWAEMPFKIGGEYYFEAVQYVRVSQRDLQENALALCPTCSAKYRKALGTSLGDLRDDLLTQDVGISASTTVDVVLAGKAETIRFVGTHAIDLQAALGATEGVAYDNEGDVDDDPEIAPEVGEAC